MSESGQPPNRRKNSFSSPTAAAKLRGLRSRGSGSSRGGGSDAGSVYSRRSVSMIQSSEDAEIFDQMNSSTGISLSKRKKVKQTAVVTVNTPPSPMVREELFNPQRAVSGVVDGLVGSAFNLMRSFSPVSDDGSEGGGIFFGNYELEESADRPRSNLDLRRNDNSFHVLASLLVEFFQAKVVGTTLLLMPEDREPVQRMLPKSAVWDFIDAVKYRLEMTPVVAVSPIQFLTLQCQELCLDRDEATENPILVAFSLKHDPVTMQVLAALSETYFTTDSRRFIDEDEEVEDAKSAASDDHDGYLKSLRQSSDGSENNSDGFVVDMKVSSGSSDESAIKVASSRDIADEMLAADVIAFDRIEGEDLMDVASEDDSMPTDHDEELESTGEVPAETFHVQSPETEEIPEVFDGEELVVVQYAEPGDCPGDGEGEAIQVLLSETDDVSAERVEGGEIEVQPSETKDVTEERAEEDDETEMQRTKTEDVDEMLATLPSETEDVDSPDNEDLEAVQPSETEDAPEQFCGDQDGMPSEDGGEALEVQPSETEKLVEIQEVDDIADSKDHLECGPSETEEAEKEEAAQSFETDGEDAPEDDVLGVRHSETEDTPEESDDDQDVVSLKTDDPQISEPLEKEASEVEGTEAEAASHASEVKSPDLSPEETMPEREGMRLSDTLFDESVARLEKNDRENTEQKKSADDNLARRMQQAAGSFFADMRSAVDAHVSTLQGNLVDKVAAKLVEPPLKEEVISIQDSSADALAAKPKEPPLVEEVTMESSAFIASSQAVSEGFFGKFQPSVFEGGSRDAHGLYKEQVRELVPEPEPVNPTKPVGNNGNGKDNHLQPFDVSKYDNMVATDIIVKQQLLVELKEAYNLMEQSVTPETSYFWRDHVLSLQARLDALHVERHAETETSPRHPDARETEVQGLHQYDTPVAQEFQERMLFETPPSQTIVQESKQLGAVSQEFFQQPQADLEQPYYDVPMVDVVSPADLPGGYHFEAEIEGQRFLATVPPGGVQQGETFTCYMRELDSVAIDIPVGYWKDGLCNMCELGWCHPVAWSSIFCPLVLLGQIQTRINLDFLGRPKFGDLPTSNRFMVLTVTAFWALTNVGLFAGCNLKWSRGLELSVADVCAFALINVAMFGFIVFVTQSTRSSLREKFMIREERCFDLEDICCAAVCLPCAVGQMSRHTANYDDYEAVCCSKTGLPDGVRVNQEPAKESESYVV